MGIGPRHNAQKAPPRSSSDLKCLGKALHTYYNTKIKNMCTPEICTFASEISKMFWTSPIQWIRPGQTPPIPSCPLHLPKALILWGPAATLMWILLQEAQNYNTLKAASLGSVIVQISANIWNKQIWAHAVFLHCSHLCSIPSGSLEEGVMISYLHAGFECSVHLCSDGNNLSNPVKKSRTLQNANMQLYKGLNMPFYVLLKVVRKSL